MCLFKEIIIVLKVGIMENCFLCLNVTSIASTICKESFII